MPPRGASLRPSSTSRHPPVIGLTRPGRVPTINMSPDAHQMPADSAPSTVGSTLREARERKGISLRQIATATKISIGALEALERNDISRLPGGIFTRAFVRSYATAVGLDPEQTIREFMAQFPHDSVTAGHPAS